MILVIIDYANIVSHMLFIFKLYGFLRLLIAGNEGETDEELMNEKLNPSFQWILSWNATFTFTAGKCILQTYCTSSKWYYMHILLSQLWPRFVQTTVYHHTYCYVLKLKLPTVHTLSYHPILHGGLSQLWSLTTGTGRSRADPITVICIYLGVISLTVSLSWHLKASECFFFFLCWKTFK